MAEETLVSDWPAGSHMEADYILVGDAPLRRLMLSVLSRLELTDEELGVYTNIRANMRLSEMTLAERNNPDSRPGLRKGHDGVARDGFQAAFRLHNIFAAVGVTNWAQPFVDGLATKDFKVVVKAIEDVRISEVNSYLTTAMFDEQVLPKVRKSVVTFTPFDDLIDINDDLRMRLGRPRGFSIEAIDGHLINPEPERWDSDGLLNILEIRIEEDFPKDKQLRVKKVLKSTDTVVANLVMGHAEDVPTKVLVKESNMAVCDITFAVEPAPVPEPEVLD